MLILQIRTDDECDYHLRKNLTKVKVRKKYEEAHKNPVAAFGDDYGV